MSKHYLSSGAVNKKLLIAIIIVMVVCGLGVGIWYVSTQLNKTENADTASEKPYAYPGNSSEQAAIAKISGEYDNGNVSVDEVQSQLDAAKKGAGSAATKQEYALTQVSIYMDSSQIDKAFSLAQETENTFKTADSAAMLAGVYNQREDYANAAKYFQLAADRSEKTTDSTQRTPYNEFMISKREAEAKL